MTSFKLKETVCKLCCESILDKSFKVLNNLAKDIQNFVDEIKYVICNSCCEKLNAAFEFKSTCLNTNNTIIPYLDFEKKLQLDLRDIYMTEKKSEQLTGISVDQKVCRLCMQLVRTDFTNIHDEELAVIQEFLPEMNINIIKDPVVCKQCFNSVRIHNLFLKRCLQVDEKIGNIYDISISESQTNNALSQDLFVKTECLDKWTEINENQMSLKVEPIEIKSEENEEESDTFLHGELDGKISNKVNPNCCEFKQKTSLNMHKCDTCDFNTKNKHYLLHQLKHKDFSQVPEYKCDECDFKSKLKNTLIKHQLTHKDFSEVQIYKCDACDYKTKRRGNFIQHQLKHKDFSEVEIYKCDACNYISKYKGDLRRHLKKHKDFSEVQMYECDSCDYRTKHKSNLLRHELTHKDCSEMRIYKCDQCDFKANIKNYLKKHQLKHKDLSEVQVYQCDTCDYKSKRINDLIVHQLKHKDLLEVRMYKCDACDYKTKRRNDLIKHQLKHKNFSEVQIYK